MIADRIIELAGAVGNDIAKDQFLPFYKTFLEDKESEVRTAACGKLADFCQIVDAAAIISQFIPQIKTLQTDQFQYVRQALAENLLPLAPKIGKNATNEHILPVFLALLRDESSDVRLNLFKRIEALNSVIGIENLSQSIIPALTELSQDKNWRIKLSVIKQFPILAKQLGEAFFNEKLTPICITWLQDDIYTIREEAIENIKQLIEIFGAQWAQRNVITKLTSLHIDQRYLHRMTPLFALPVLGPVLPAEEIKKSFVPVLQALSSDRVANVRMNVAKQVIASSKFLKTRAELVQPISQILSGLNGDQDTDVKYFAGKALQSLK